MRQQEGSDRLIKSRLKNTTLDLMAKRAVIQFMANRAAVRQKLRVKYFDSWHPELDEALKALPEHELCTHELFRLLMQNRPGARKCTALVTENNEPVAVAGLRQRDYHWEPVTQWIVLGMPFPIEGRYIGRVLPALGVELHVAWWRYKATQYNIGGTTNLTESRTYGIQCSAHFEDYWKKSGHLNTVRQMRKKCRKFDLEINSRNAAERAIRSWETNGMCPHTK